MVIGELATAAGLSSFNLVAGPLFYLGHEAVWNYFGESDVAVELPASASVETGWGELKISRALAKTITYRAIASALDVTGRGTLADLLRNLHDDRSAHVRGRFCP